MSQPQALPAFTEAELTRRRVVARRTAWALGALVLAIYILGMFVTR